jgi:hypothetical protein
MVWDLRRPERPGKTGCAGGGVSIAVGELHPGRDRVAASLDTVCALVAPYNTGTVPEVPGLSGAPGAR